jgi:hypothetical protein
MEGREMQKIRWFGGLLIFSLLWVEMAFAQTDYTITGSFFRNVAVLTGGSYALNSMIGQSEVGYSSSDQYTVVGGPALPITLPTPTTIYLPIVVR